MAARGFSSWGAFMDFWEKNFKAFGVLVLFYFLLLAIMFIRYLYKSVVDSIKYLVK